jgi:anti-sigma B factor antagonist
MSDALHRLALDSDLTIYNAEEKKRQLVAAVRNAEAVDLDLSQVGEMDTAGFQLLIMAKREAQRLGHTLNITAHSPAVREVIEFYNMTAFFGDPVVIPAGDRA